jgi:hypothetical protein
LRANDFLRSNAAIRGKTLILHLRTNGAPIMRTSFATAVAASVGLVLAQTAVGQNADKKLGTVHFATSCNPEAQKLFDRGMLYQHSFWYRASQKEFEDVLKADPECGIAYWGVALSLLWNPHVPTPAKNLTDGAAAIAKAKAVGAKTQRERDYVDALSAMYADFDKVDRGARMQNYTKAMEQLAERYPKDDEAQIHYALALNTSASSADKTYANQLKGAAILEPIAKRQPQHPGVAHYLIHLYDYPAIAAKGIEAARRYAKIAPGAAHAQHMPSHIFTRVGYWKESIASNIVAARVAKEAKDFHEQLHPMDYTVYAYLQLGQDSKAKAVLDDMTTVTGFTETFLVGPYALAVSPARYAIERDDWQAAAALPVRPSPLPQVQAVTYFARALGAARSGHPEAAKAEIAKLDELHGKLKDAYLGRANRYPAASCGRVDAVCRGQARRRAQGHGCGGRCRGQDRKASGDAGCAQTGTRALWRDAARKRKSQGSARRFRGDAEEGTQPPRRLRRRGQGRRKVRRQGQGAGVFRKDRVNRR